MLGTVIDLLEHPPHRQQQCRAELRKAFRQCRTIRPMSRDHTEFQAGELADARERMRERQEHPRRAAMGLEDLRSRTRRVADVGEQVAAREPAALRPAGRT
jgi:hypothetical protein